MTKTVPLAQRSPMRGVIRRFQEFIHLEASSGILLLICTIIALIWANSPWADSYTRLWGTPFTISFGEAGLSKALILWINDGLMAVFFFVVGLEIKREILDGELSSPRQAALPIAAALGGMVVPALLYTLLNLGTPGISGWGIPMATDIAFALGVLALLGNRIPLSLKVFLTALAIVDDLGAVMVIALFYTAEIAWTYLGISAGLFGLLMVINRFGVRSLSVYILIGLVLWVMVLKSGVHATVAGVLLAMAIPSQTKTRVDNFVEQQHVFLDELDSHDDGVVPEQLNEQQQSAVQAIETSATNLQSPLQRLEHALHPWVAFFIMPIFALANAGVAIEGSIGASLTETVSLGIIAGLAIGKPLGITLFSWLALRIGLATLPADISMKHIHGAGWIAGIGFTMALFIAGLAFGSSPLLTTAKIGILAASLLAGGIGFLILRRIKPIQPL